MTTTVKIIIVIICSYFLGNITFARPVSRAVKDDITTHGSGNPGTMNMMRTFGAKLGFLTLLLDLLKGVVCCLCSYYIFGGKSGGQFSLFMEYIAGFSCFIGHIYPAIYKFKGGKGVATAAGIGFCVNPILMSIIAVSYFFVLLLTEIASLTSMICVSSFIFIETVFVCLKHYYFLLIPLYAVLFFVIYAHRANIVRLINHNENKVHIRKIFKKKAKTSVETNDNQSESTNTATPETQNANVIDISDIQDDSQSNK